MATRNRNDGDYGGIGHAWKHPLLFGLQAGVRGRCTACVRVFRSAGKQGEENGQHAHNTMLAARTAAVHSPYTPPW